jgi:hypothetical protein
MTDAKCGARKVILSVVVIGLSFGALSARGSTFYVDAMNGDDSNAGMSPGEAWATIVPVNTHPFQPGDRILFHAGQRWTGELAPRESGTRETPIVIDRYADGAKP